MMQKLIKNESAIRKYTTERTKYIIVSAEVISLAFSVNLIGAKRALRGMYSYRECISCNHTSWTHVQDITYTRADFHRESVARRSK